MRPTGGIVVVLAALLAAGSCLGGNKGVALNALMSSTPPQTLSATGLFVDSGARAPAPGVLPYDLTTPLYSDGAVKHRFIWMPQGREATAPANSNAVLDLPVGTVLVKTFALTDPAAPAGERTLETRLLVHQAAGWTALPYVWNAAGTEARLVPQGATIAGALPSAGPEPAADWHVPNRNQCKTCHQVDGRIEPIGVRLSALNKPYAYPDGPSSQVARWQAIGYLSSTLPAGSSASVLPVWNDPASGTLEARARAYLDMNCAHCHRPGGSASNSGLLLGFDQTEPVKLGLFKRPVAAGRGSGDRFFDIVPGKPDRSILVYRMESTDPGERMPELGRSLVHGEGVALVRDWIASTPTKPEP